jgi:thiamine-monophosphate kinase
MEAGKLGERKLIRLIRGSVRQDSGLVAGFDDDAAVFRVGKRLLAVTCDASTLGTHFQIMDAKKIGKKIVSSNASDLLAKGALPRYMLASAAFPPNTDAKFIARLYKSIDASLKKYGAYLVGGDTDRGDQISIAVTMIGEVLHKPLLRANAKEGDWVVLSGRIGGAAAAYKALGKGIPSNKIPKNILEAQLAPEINLALCNKLIKKANAGIDISDGLAFELGEIARLSKKKIVFDWDKLPLEKDLEKFCEKNGIDLEEVTLHCGEDYQIVYTMKEKPREGFVVGRVEKGKGVWMKKGGRVRAVEPRGWEHFVSN